MTKQKDLIKNTLIIAFGKLSTQFLTFLLLPLYTTYLAASEFGTVDLVMTYVALLAPVITISLEMGVFRFLIDARGKGNQQTRVISTALRIVAGLLAVAGVLYFFIQLFIDIPYGIYAFGAIAALICSNILLQIARGFGNNLQFAIGGMVAGIATIIVNIWLIVILGMGAVGMLLAIIAANLACATYLFFALKIYRYIRPGSFDKELAQELLGYSAPLVPNGVAWWAINAADRTIVTIILGVASNGIYAVAYRFPLVFNGLFSFFGMSWTESASVHINSKDRDQFFSHTMNASVQLFGSLGICMIALVPLVFGLLVDSAYSEAYMYIPVLLLGAFFNSVVGLYSAIYIAKKLTRQVMNTSLVAAAVSILTTIATIGTLGLYAPALAMCVAFLTMAVFRHYDVKKYVSIRYDVVSLIILSGAFAVVACLYYLNNPILNILNIAFAAVCAIFLNRSIVKVVKTKIMSRLRPLTPDQQVAEEMEK